MMCFTDKVEDLVQTEHISVLLRCIDFKGEASIDLN